MQTVARRKIHSPQLRFRTHTGVTIMPVFEHKADLSNLDSIVAGYLECAEFTMDEELQALADVEWSDNAESIAAERVAQFLAVVGESHIAAYREQYTPSHGYDIEQCLGHDIWYTSNGHGVGFWDRGLGDLGERLTTASKAIRSHDVYAGDEGLLYLG